MIYAGINGYLDAIPVAKVGAYEQGLLRLLRAEHGSLLDGIRDKKELTSDLGASLKSVVEAYTKSFA